MQQWHRWTGCRSSPSRAAASGLVRLRSGWTPMMCKSNLPVILGFLFLKISFCMASLLLVRPYLWVCPVGQCSLFFMYLSNSQATDVRRLSAACRRLATRCHLQTSRVRIDWYLEFYAEPASPRALQVPRRATAGGTSGTRRSTFPASISRT